VMTRENLRTDGLEARGEIIMFAACGEEPSGFAVIACAGALKRVRSGLAESSA